MELVKFLGVVGIVLMIVEYAEPIEWIKVYFNISEKSNPKQLYKQLLKKLLNCCLCTGTWVGAAFYLNVYWAVIIAFSSEIAYNLLRKLNQILFVK